ncbi:MAG: hypothetical protein AVDCRST_MAG64-1833 [uncultured Phycisphaerae bacterium]|uniref:Ferritin-like domain-containing protein n=1 Tax=uncultured Phycisphaerae bacterium TaxID=904963 RepID=A0A6J4P452_9BACT|nr:MAG: hypothetical protein AVDCRST_MAG64-1833 [uncultured Phycisphaerae bacterium]
MTELRSITSSADWCRHFADNARRQHPIPWELGADATPAELAAIVPSLRGWQLGETSDGSHLLAAAAGYATAAGDPAFLDAARLFISEEQRHGEALGRFLDLAGAERSRFDWGDWLFRNVRYLSPRMEVWATPVVMVETHAMVYYNALRRATRSRVLRAICRQILADEVPHIRFQCERLAVLHRARGPWLMAVTRAVHVTFFAAVTLAVWAGHRRALRAGGYGFRRFWRAAWGRMNHAWRQMSTAAYLWPAASAAAEIRNPGRTDAAPAA